MSVKLCLKSFSGSHFEGVVAGLRVMQGTADQNRSVRCIEILLDALGLGSGGYGGYGGGGGGGGKRVVVGWYTIRPLDYHHSTCFAEILLDAPGLEAAVCLLAGVPTMLVTRSSLGLTIFLCLSLHFLFIPLFLFHTFFLSPFSLHSLSILFSLYSLCFFSLLALSHLFHLY